MNHVAVSDELDILWLDLRISGENLAVRTSLIVTVVCCAFSTPSRSRCKAREDRGSESYGNAQQGQARRVGFAACQGQIRGRRMSPCGVLELAQRGALDGFRDRIVAVYSSRGACVCPSNNESFTEVVRIKGGACAMHEHRTQ